MIIFNKMMPTEIRVKQRPGSKWDNATFPTSQLSDTPVFRHPSCPTPQFSDIPVVRQLFCPTSLLSDNSGYGTGTVLVPFWYRVPILVPSTVPVRSL